MNEVRMGQIALLCLKYSIRNQGIPLKPDYEQQIKNAANAIGISVQEAKIFSKILLREILEEKREERKRQVLAQSG